MLRPTRRFLAVRRFVADAIFASSAAHQPNRRSFSGTASSLRSRHSSDDDDDDDLIVQRQREFIVLKSTGRSSAVDLGRFPLVWLRDNCQCPACFHRESTSRIIDWTRFDVNVQPTEIRYEQQTGRLTIDWSDEHRSVFERGWLNERSFDAQAQNAYAHHNGYRPARRAWSADEFDRLIAPDDDDDEHRYADIVRTDAGLRRWLRHLAVHGVAMIRGAPAADTSVCRTLAERVAFIRPTHYGTEFHVRNTPGTHNVAYLAAPLQMHTDLPYYEFAPGVNLLHCVEQSNAPEGAFNMLCDGLWVAEEMRRRWPDEFALLTEVEVDWLDVGVDNGFAFDKRYRAPVICLDRDGQVRRINHSVPQRDSRFTCPADRVADWYGALDRFVRLVYAGSVHFKTQPGDILTFDNARLVHGRTGYTDVPNNVRHIVGAYLDWDEIYSRLRVLDAAAKVQ